MEKEKASKLDIKFFWFSSCLYVLWGIAYLFAGILHPDESTYIYASKIVFKGMIPYRDFLYIQTPLFPYLYGFFIKIIGYPFITGRFIGLLLGFLIMFFIRRLTRRFGDENAVFIATALYVFCSCIIYFTVIVRSFTPVMLFLLIAADSYFWSKPKFLKYVMPPFFFALAVSSRLTMLPMLCVILLFYIITEWKNPKNMLLALASGIITFLIFNLPFYIISDGRMYWNTFKLHTMFAPPTYFLFYMRKFEFIWLSMQDFFFFMLLLAISIFYWITKHPLEMTRKNPFYFALAAALAMTTAGHLSANYTQETYSTSLYPLSCSLLAVAFIHIWKNEIGKVTNNTKIIIILLGFAWYIQYGTRSLRFIEGKPIMLYLQKVGNEISKATRGEGYMLSHDTPTWALFSNHDLLSGTENCEYFPDYTEEQCRYYHVLNDSIITDEIKNRKPSVIVVSDQSFRIFFPPNRPCFGKQEYFFDLLKKHYKLYKTVPYQFLPETAHSYIYIRD